MQISVTEKTEWMAKNNRLYNMQKKTAATALESLLGDQQASAQSSHTGMQPTDGHQLEVALEKNYTCTLKVSTFSLTDVFFL